jgi:hypothetical protein
LRQQPKRIWALSPIINEELKRGVSPSSKEIFPFPSEGKGIRGIG